MKVLHVTPSFYPALVYGGPTQSVYQLCCALVRNKCEVRVLTTDANGPDAVLNVDTHREVEIVKDLWVRYSHRLMDVSVSPALLRLLTARIRWADVVHLMAVYSFPTIPTLLLCKFLGKPVVWSPRGMLQRWEGTRRPRLKALWEMVCRSAAPQTFILHVTSVEEAKQSAARMPGLEMAVIANGVEIPESATHNTGHHGLRVVYLGRLDPIKGIENLLQARSILKDDTRSSLSLVIAGAGSAEYTKHLQYIISRMSPVERPKMVGAVLGGEKERLFANADVVVVPSHTENFGLVVAEALARAVPVIASKGTPWQRVEEIGCGLWVDNSPQSLANAIKQISRMPLREMGRRGREWMLREFSWDLTAKRTMELYDSMLRSNGD